MGLTKKLIEIELENDVCVPNLDTDRLDKIISQTLGAESIDDGRITSKNEFGKLNWSGARTYTTEEGSCRLIITNQVHRGNYAKVKIPKTYVTQFSENLKAQYFEAYQLFREHHPKLFR